MPTREEKAILDNGCSFGDYWKTNDITKDPFLEDYVTIAEFLKGGSKTATAGLKALNDAMVKVVGDDLTKVADELKAYYDKRAGGFASAKVPARESAYRGVLSRVLAKAEKDNSFNVKATERPVPTLARFHTAAEFGQLFKDRTPFKDPGAKPDHGEFTHRIQWYLLYPDTAGSPKLNDAPAKVFEALSQYLPEH